MGHRKRTGTWDMWWRHTWPGAGGTGSGPAGTSQAAPTSWVLLCGAGSGLGLLQRLSVRSPQMTLLRPLAQGHSGLWGGGCHDDRHRDREGLVAGSWAPGLGGTWESGPCPQPGIGIWCLVEKLLVAQEVRALSGALPHLGGRGCPRCSSRGGAGSW